MGWRLARLGVALCTCVYGLWACLLTEPAHLRFVEGMSFRGACMCARCWDRDFCWNAVTLEHCGPGEACCGDPLSQRAQRATFVTSLFERSDPESMYCIWPEGKDLDPDGVSCDVEDRTELQNVECDDIRPCAYEQEYESCGDQVFPPCYYEGETGPVRTACGEDEAHGQAKLVDKCEHIHPEVAVPPADPDLGPERVCFLACGDALFTGEGWNDCDPDVWDPPQVRHSSMEIEVAGTAMIDVRVNGDSDSDMVDVEGVVALSGCGPGEVCEAEISLVVLSGLDSFHLFDDRGDDLRLLNQVALRSEPGRPDVHRLGRGPRRVRQRHERRPDDPRPARHALSRPRGSSSELKKALDGDAAPLLAAVAKATVVVAAPAEHRAVAAQCARETGAGRRRGATGRSRTAR